MEISGFYDYFIGAYSAALSVHINLGYPAVTIADVGMPEGYAANRSRKSRAVFRS